MRDGAFPCDTLHNKKQAYGEADSQPDRRVSPDLGCDRNIYHPESTARTNRPGGDRGPAVYPRPTGSGVTDRPSEGKVRLPDPEESDDAEFDTTEGTLADLDSISP